MSASQEAQIRAWLASGRSLTALEALERFGCLRLAARVKELRNDGLRIDATMVKRDGKEYARYTMPDARPVQLDLIA